MARVWECWGPDPIAEAAGATSTDLATNIGAGVTYRLSEHLGLNADWRTFFVNGDNDVERFNRFTTGFSVSLR